MSSHVPVGLPSLDLHWTMSVHQDGDAFVSAQLQRDGCWEPFESMVIARLLSAAVARDGSGPLFVDCGANIGWYSLLAAQLGAEVLAVEPMPDNAAKLRGNVTVNGLGHRITVEECALGDRRGRAELHLSTTNQGDHRLHAEESWDVSRRRSTVAVDVRTLSELLGLLELSELSELSEHRRPRVLKLDTQGSESAILRGGADCWTPRAGVPGTAVVTEFWPYGLERCGSSAGELVELLMALMEHGHRCFEVVEPSHRLVPMEVDQLVGLPLAAGLSTTVRGFTNLALVPADLVHALDDLVTA